MDKLQSVEGVGNKKVKKYGEDVLKIVKPFIKNKQKPAESNEPAKSKPVPKEKASDQPLFDMVKENTDQTKVNKEKSKDGS